MKRIMKSGTAPWIAWLALYAVFAAMAMVDVVKFENSDYALHFYGRPGQANVGLVVGDCYHFDMGVEFAGSPGFFVNEC
jgi:hypothetical protein